MKKVFFILLFIIIFSLSIYLYLYFKEEPSSLKQEPKVIEKEEEKIDERTASLIMVGDALIHESIYKYAKEDDGYDFKKIFTLVKPIIEEYDLAFYNQETILGGTELGLSTYPTFNSPYEVGDAFLDMGFNLVSLANNHTLDRGSKAVLNSRSYWNKQDVLVSGSASSKEERDKVVIKEVNGIKYTLLAYTTSTNGIRRPNDYYVNFYDANVVKEDIERVRDEVDYLFVSMHWGIEYNPGVSNEQKEIAKYLASLGVDIVIGHHPHVIEPFEYIDDTLVIYSLGNFISSQNGSDRLSGAMIAVDLNLIEGVKSFSNLEATLIYTYYKNTAPRTNYLVYPYSSLDESILANYQQQFKVLKERLSSLNPNIVVR